MFDYCCLDNLAAPNMALGIENRVMTGAHWEYIESTVDNSSFDKGDSNIINSQQFVHLIYGDNGPCSMLYGEVVNPILWSLQDKTGVEITSIQRIKANLLTPNGSTVDNYNPPHIDINKQEYLSMVYYVNDSDGDTRIFDKNVEQGFDNMTIIHSNTPSQGNAIIFPSNRFHCSSNPIQSNVRCIINFVFTVKDISILNKN